VYFLLLLFLCEITDTPKIPPFSVVIGRLWSSRLVAFRIGLNHLRMIFACSLNSGIALT
jgi:hypothetical protein